MLIAITRQVSPAIESCELTYLPRRPIDREVAHGQHRCYEQSLARCGCAVVSLPAIADLADSVFVEDTAVVLDETAIMTNPGVDSRRREVSLMARELARFRELQWIDPPATLEGGDVMRVGSTVYVGTSARTNKEGVDQLEKLLAPLGYSVRTVEVSGCLHLKSAVTPVGPSTLLVNPEWVSPRRFEGLNVLRVDPSEPYGANALLVGRTVIYPASFPRTRAGIEAEGIAVETVDVSELQKAEGAVTCCSLIFESGGVVD